MLRSSLQWLRSSVVSGKTFGHEFLRDPEIATKTIIHVWHYTSVYQQLERPEIRVRIMMHPCRTTPLHCNSGHQFVSPPKKITQLPLLKNSHFLIGNCPLYTITKLKCSPYRGAAQPSCRHAHLPRREKARGERASAPSNLALPRTLRPVVGSSSGSAKQHPQFRLAQQGDPRAL